MPFDADSLVANLTHAGIETYRVTTRATNRVSFLLRPDLGRELSADSRAALAQQHAAWGRRDLAIIVSDGLSALAATRQIEPTLVTLLPLLRTAGFSIYPILVAPFARVKLQDEIGELLQTRHTLMLLGERPGLGAPDSLGAYFTFAPAAIRTDADRNCVSNIRPEGLAPVAAAHKLAHLLASSARLGVSGIALKDTSLDSLAG
jgi:ethanolamine ammonia-lyase small subunit